jgi:purine-binding chemotaxis protein CheW
MDNGQRSPNGVNAEMLQQALRAFGTGNAPANTAELAALAQRMGIALPTVGVASSQTEATTGTQYVFLALDTIEMAWPAPKVVGVERISDVTPVPNTASWVLGVASLRGAITSVVDLRRFFGLLPQAMSARSRVVVAAAGGMVIGFLVDGVNEIRVIPPEAQTADGIRQVSPPWLLPYVAAQAQLGERRIFVVDIERLLFADNLHHYRAD